MRNPGGEIYSLRVDVPIVNLDVNVLLDKNHQFVKGLKADNFLVVEDGKEQQVQTVRVTKTPITAVLLLEFAANSYAFVYDMRNTAASFFRSLQPEDYVAVETYDLRPHILTDFTNNKDTIAEALQSLVIPGFRETNEFDALYETLDRLSRVEGRKYIILGLQWARHVVPPDLGQDAGQNQGYAERHDLHHQHGRLRARDGRRPRRSGAADAHGLSAGGQRDEYVRADDGWPALRAQVRGRAAGHLRADQRVHPQPVCADLPADQHPQ